MGFYGRLEDEDTSVMDWEEQEEHEALLDERKRFVESFNGRDPDEVMKQQEAEVDAELMRMFHE